MQFRTFLADFKRMLLRRACRFCFTAFVLGLLMVAAHPAKATTVIVVTSLADKVTSTGGCSLKEAVFAANYGLAEAIDRLNADGIDQFTQTSCVVQGSGAPVLIELPVAGGPGAR